ncbi:UMP-CMP kinase [Athalia rosae]|uniref:UMP-CMP kinase n=1 Tax=Athalia rosae TaxID=37344 RepID=UPI002033E21E|nr:UMP-CMP kinase [Athalia rosae]
MRESRSVLLNFCSKIFIGKSGRSWPLIGTENGNTMDFTIPPILGGFFVDRNRSNSRTKSMLCGHISRGSTYRCSLIIRFPMYSRLVTALRKITMSSVTIPKVIFVLGGPGAGKGTQCAKAVEKFGYVHLSAGELLREEQHKTGSKLGEMIEKHMVDGTIVPVEVTCSLLAQAMDKFAGSTFLIDGFPRNTDNLEGWNRIMSDKVNLVAVLFFDCSKETCIERCLRRGETGSGRSDDNEATLMKRYQTYLNATLPIIQHYEKEGLVHKIDASKPSDEVFEDVEKILESL